MFVLGSTFAAEAKTAAELQKEKECIERALLFYN
jgi:hypothetical protein